MTTAETMVEPTAEVRVHPYSFLDVLRAEWLKFRTIRSSWWALASFVVVTIAISALASWAKANDFNQHHQGGSFDPFNPTQFSLLGTIFGQLAIGVLGVLVVTSEYSSGTIRSSLQAVPRRGQLFAAKLLVLVVVVYVVAQVTVVASFLFGQVLFHSTGHADTLSSVGVKQTLLSTALFLVATAIATFGFGFLFRNGIGAIFTYVGLLFPVDIIVSVLPNPYNKDILKFLPNSILFRTISPIVTPDNTTLFTRWIGIALMALYAVVLAGVALFSFLRRDA